MKSANRKMMAGLGILITLVFMVLLGYCVYAYLGSSEDTTFMVSMGLLSSGLMTFLVIFALLYNHRSPSEDYSEMYLGICGGCGSKLDENGVCPVCKRIGRRRSP